MLTELKVKDLGIIEDMDWRLDAGFNVITGETGAGKSLIIDAIELLLTGSAGEDVIRTGAAEARIEGVFSLSPPDRYAALKAFLAAKGLPDEEVLVVSCEVRKGKPAAVRLNGHITTKGLLRQVGQMLIDIHGQSQHLSLLDKKFHLDFLDTFGHNLEARTAFAAGFARLQEIESILHELVERENDRQHQQDFLRFQIDEIANARLVPGEDVQLEEERRLSSMSEKLKEYAQQVNQALDDREFAQDASSVLARLNQAAGALRKLVALDPSLKSQLDVLERTLYDLEESARDIRAYADRQRSDPRRLEEIESRWELLKNLKRKYGHSLEEILSYQAAAEKDLAALSGSAEQQTLLSRERERLLKELAQRALDLSASRTEAARLLTAAVATELDELDMGRMKFEVNINRSTYNSAGIDDIEFEVSTNPGEPLKPLVRIASTGEISRFTLALKGALSEADSIPVLVFDEIDIGVGARSGDVLGRKLWRLAQTHQVVCVTHLSQIAVYADSHFCVTKTTQDDRTASTLSLLTGERRLAEVALMLAGPGHSASALKSAAEMQKKADGWKKPGQLKF